MNVEKKLLTINEFCEYVGRVFVHKELFDEELKKNAKYQLTM